MSSVHQPAISKERRERAFREGVDFHTFVERAELNRDLLHSNYNGYTLTEEEKAFFGSLKQPIDVLVLAQDWCGDAVSNLPLFGKIADETGNLRLHIVNRDPDNLDIAAAYPHADGKSRIPTYIFFADSGDQLGVFIERPEVITSYNRKWSEQFWDEHPEYEGRGIPPQQLDTPVRKAYFAYLKHQRPSTLDEEKAGILDILRAFLR
ncbi:thioredoxin family protein [Paenibacillus hemerocallicola]|uniref:Thioredoxin family protein n=1 Tax=Paenibacillus hemerocallicola TaxID=1172614 RepID=A0A5C4TD19_9BACL|nr:thioredoxin family protein [Paenibacillus hemerocallicola]TNJ66973.1 thioredoxin family protein [Paenibacillus hemerocallicola]